MPSNLHKQANAPIAEAVNRHGPDLSSFPQQGKHESTVLLARPENQGKFNAGLVFVLARALQRHGPEHIAVGQAAHWLRRNGFEKKAGELEAAKRTSTHAVKHE